MIRILAIRDNEERVPVSVEEVAPDAAEAALTEARTKYPPPRYEILLAVAPDLSAFLTAYPRFKKGKE